MALTRTLGPFVLYSVRDLSSPVDHGKEEASMTYKAGALLLNDAGQLEEAGADPTNITGVALAAATGVENADVPFIIPRADVEFEATFTTSAFTYALLGTEQFGRYGVAKDNTTGFWYIDQAETTTDVVVITGFVDPVGTINPRVRCKFIQSLINAA